MWQIHWFIVFLVLLRHGFINESCRLKMTFSTKRFMLLSSAPRRYSSQSCVNPSGDALFFSCAAWPISNTTLIRILLLERGEEKKIKKCKKSYQFVGTHMCVCDVMQVKCYVEVVFNFIILRQHNEEMMFLLIVRRTKKKQKDGEKKRNVCSVRNHMRLFILCLNRCE